MPGTSFGKYELRTLLAKGGMGETYLAEMRGAAGITKTVVIKKMLPAIAKDATLVEQFIQEARISSGLSHGNIAQVFDFGEVDGEYFLAMEYVNGRSLHKLIERQAPVGDGRLPFEISAYLVIELLKALHYAHTRVGADGKSLGLVHRDVTPDNVMVSWEGDVKLVDFGVAKARMKGRTETEPGLVKGKVRYLSPEQATAAKLDARSDVFTTGIVLYELLTGERAFSGNEHDVMRAIVRGQVVPVRVRAPDVPEALALAAETALKAPPHERFQSALEMQEALARWLFRQTADFSGEVVRELMGELFADELEQQGTPFVPRQRATTALRALRAPPGLPTEKRLSPNRARPWLAAGVTAAVVALLGLAAVALVTPGEEPAVPRGPEPLARPAPPAPKPAPAPTPAGVKPMETRLPALVPRAAPPVRTPQEVAAQKQASLLLEQANVFFSLGRGQYPDAKQKLVSCIAVQPTHAECHMLLGTVLTALGDAEGGAREYREFITLAPDNPKGERVRDLLAEYDREMSVCSEVLKHVEAATDAQLFECGRAPHALAQCSIYRCPDEQNCACHAYVRSERLCDAKTGMCRAPLSGTGCSDSSYYAGPPFHCSGDAVTQSACMLRYLITHKLCG